MAVELEQRDSNIIKKGAELIKLNYYLIFIASLPLDDTKKVYSC